MYIGDMTFNQVFTTAFNTSEFTTGEGETLAGTPSVEAFKDGDYSTPISVGVTLTPDPSGKTGLNKLAINLSDAVYTKGSDWVLLITQGLVGSASAVSKITREFSIENRFMRGTDNAALATLLSAAMPSELYAAKGAIPSANEAILMILQHLTEAGSVGPNWTTRKLDGVATAAVYTITLDGVTSEPIDISRVS